MPYAVIDWPEIFWGLGETPEKALADARYWLGGDRTWPMLHRPPAEPVRPRHWWRYHIGWLRRPFSEWNGDFRIVRIDWTLYDWIEGYGGDTAGADWEGARYVEREDQILTVAWPSE